MSRLRATRQVPAVGRPGRTSAPEAEDRRRAMQAAPVRTPDTEVATGALGVFGGAAVDAGPGLGRLAAASSSRLALARADAVISRVPGVADPSLVEKVPAHLRTGIEPAMEPMVLLTQLLANFFARSDFNYTGATKNSPWVTEGDCATLVFQFRQAAKAYGLDVKSESTGADDNIYVPGATLIHSDKSKTSNIQGDGGIFFGSHTWAVYEGMPIDVLFGQLGVVGHAMAKETKDPKGRPEWSVGGPPFYLAKNATNFFDKYTTDPANRSNVAF
ncbi:MAG: hypothetical protein ACKV2O_00770 [Acidimicrobiales bacterium]